MPRRRRRWPRALAIAALAIVAVLVVARLVLDPLVAWRTRIVLGDIPGHRARFADVHVSVRDLSYRITDLRIEKLSAGGAALPFFQVDAAEIGLYWKELVRGHVVAGIRLDGPRLNVIAAEAKQERQAEEVEEVGFNLAELAPVRVDRFEARDGAILFVDRTSPREPRLRLHGIEATVENFATRAALARGEPTVLALRGTLQKSGKVSIFATSDPLAKKLTFAGQAKLDGLPLTELGALLADKSGLVPEHGTLDLSARFVAEGGRLTGGVRPVLKDPDVRSADDGVGARLKAFLADAALDVFSDDVPGRDAVATTIPIRGTLDAPQVEVLPTILGIVRNAFVAGLADSLSDLPPKEAREANEEEDAAGPRARRPPAREERR
jgi:uncharacterized protein YhdP